MTGIPEMGQIDPLSSYGCQDQAVMAAWDCANGKQIIEELKDTLKGEEGVRNNYYIMGLLSVLKGSQQRTKAHPTARFCFSVSKAVNSCLATGAGVLTPID
jgi:hypothetical protein